MTYGSLFIGEKESKVFRKRERSAT